MAMITVDKFTVRKVQDFTLPKVSDDAKFRPSCFESTPPDNLMI